MALKNILTRTTVFSFFILAIFTVINARPEGSSEDEDKGSNESGNESSEIYPENHLEQLEREAAESGAVERCLRKSDPAALYEALQNEYEESVITDYATPDSTDGESTSSDDYATPNSTEEEAASLDETEQEQVDVAQPSSSAIQVQTSELDKKKGKICGRCLVPVNKLTQVCPICSEML
ncbi:uncharacterized protein LOC126845649 isoform X3 [Adelges cooleyi]|uniref:uncharacterized protein LOC126845649 isoform X3 n=1 Tax=Adelges cooleyi TaxID=133065 RepID=UPI00217FE31D|nr:uncharacterized protein LOC126845649 isoform X3 [Adelges cooleyi]